MISWRTTIITATKQLQDQYVENDRQIFDSARAHELRLSVQRRSIQLGYLPHASQEGLVQAQGQSCPYVKRRNQWTMMAQLRSTNFSFQIEAPEKLCMTPETKANLIVIDECHEIDMALIEHATIKFNVADFSQLADIGYEWLTVRIQKFIDIFANVGEANAFTPDREQIDALDDLCETIENVTEALEESMAESSDMREIKGAMVESLQLIRAKTENFGQGNDEWILNEYKRGQLVELKPVYSEQVAYHGLIQKAEYFLHMSATICGFDQYIESLGLRADDCAVIDVANPIPVDQRKVFVLPQFKVNAGFDAYPRLVKVIDKIISTTRKRTASSIASRSNWARRSRSIRNTRTG
jgi:ATP-dependent DNA helicase DinG